MENTNEKSLTYAWYVVGLLMLANISSFIDRQILSLLVKSIKQDMHLSDFEVSLLMGLSFALFYTFFGMIIGYYADRYNRRNIIIGGIAIWSVMTSLCVGVRNYGQFFLARMGVGIGEATLSPSAYSIITDYFPKKRLSSAMSVYSLGIFLGSGLALLIVSQIIPSLPVGTMVKLPVFGEVFPWQLLFMIVGVPGLIVGLLMLTVREPERKGMLEKDGKVAKLSFAESLKLIFQHRVAYLGISFGGAFSAFVSYGLNAWGPTYFNRTFGWSMPQAGFNFGVMLLISSTLGVLWGGWYADHLVKKEVTDGRVRVGLITTLAILAAAFVPLLHNPYWVLIGFGIPAFGIAGNIGAAASAIQELMPNQVRVLAGAIFLFILNMVGMGLGPTGVAFFTDFVFKDENAIHLSLVGLAVIGGIAGSLSFGLAMKPYRQAIINSKLING